MIWVIRRLSGLKGFFSFLLALQFTLSPVIFSSRGFDLPRLKGSCPTITASSSPDMCLIYSVFTAHHKRSGVHHQTHRSSCVILSRSSVPLLAQRPFEFRAFMKMLSFNPAPFYPPPAVVLA